MWASLDVDLLFKSFINPLMLDFGLFRACYFTEHTLVLRCQDFHILRDGAQASALIREKDESVPPLPPGRLICAYSITVCSREEQSHNSIIAF